MNTPINDTPEPTSRPLGYWLRVVNRRISARFAETLAAEQLDRRDWMLLNLLSGDIVAPERLARFIRRGRRLAAFRDRGWATDADGTWGLTDAGREAKERIGEKVADIRHQVAEAVSPEDFATTLASLEAIARSLGDDLDSEDGRIDEFGRGPRRHGRRGHGSHRGHGHGGHRGHGFGHGHGHGHGHGYGFGHGHGHGFGHGDGFSEGYGHPAPEHDRPCAHAHRHAGYGDGPGPRHHGRGFGPHHERRCA